MEDSLLVFSGEDLRMEINMLHISVLVLNMCGIWLYMEHEKPG